MTPKEKADELFNKFCYAIGTDRTDSGYYTNIIYAKQCALIAVDEIYNGGLHLRYGAYLDEFEDKQNYYSYWEDVKIEIEKL